MKKRTIVCTSTIAKAMRKGRPLKDVIRQQRRISRKGGVK